ncbi:MAG: hypothetical protein JNL79_04060 [Myxococcales bacterium]|nr:hypothetical protein [Myxococcales bacterium]
MGADEFFTTSKGDSAREAFGAATRQAAYEDGHGGYTGTIAEKHDFVMLTDRKMLKKEAFELAQDLIEKGDRRACDKWGPALCIALEDGRFLFFGLASS